MTANLFSQAVDDGEQKFTQITEHYKAPIESFNLDFADKLKKHIASSGFAKNFSLEVPFKMVEDQTNVP